ncbi:MAG: leucine-rich repeat domain-containing protein [Clostridia bacterium]|nr:leucine-rich repeat domain-containing protein [Clostridia bacterium]
MCILVHIMYIGRIIMKNLLLKLLTIIFALTLCLGIFTACGDNKHTHDYKTLKNDSTSHWQECSCGDKYNVENHNYSNGYVSNNNGTKTATCECGITSVVVDENILIVENNVIVGVTYFGKILRTIVIPNGILGVGERAFSSCTSLESIEIPNSVTSIGYDDFSYCRSLTSIVIPNSVTSIGVGAFSDCYSLESIVIPNSVTSIGHWAFYGCDSLRIYCEAESQPIGWISNWNYSDCPVVWGYKGN